MPDPYIRKQPSDLIRAADWNQIQVDARTDIEQHDHTGGEDGVQLSTDALRDGAVTRPKIAEGAVGFDTLAQEVRDALQGDGGGLTLELTPGSVSTDHLADNAVTGDKLANGAVLSGHLATSAVTSDKLAVSSVHTGHILANAVQTGHIADGVITGAKLAGGAVRAEHILSRAVQTGHIGDGVITGAKLAGGAVTVEALARDVIELVRNGGARFDAVTTEWSWSQVQPQRSARFPYTGQITGFHSALGNLHAEIVARAGAAQFPAFLRALRVLTDHLEPDFLHVLNSGHAYQVLNHTRLQSALIRQDLLDDALLEKVFDIIDLAYSDDRPWVSGLLVAIARLGDVSAIAKVSSMSSYDDGTDVVDKISSYYSAVLSYIEALTGLASPVLAPGGAPLPFIELPEVTSTDDAVFEVEMELLLYSEQDNIISAVGIGTEQNPPLPAELTIVHSPYLASNKTHYSVTLRRRIRHREGYGIRRTARLWGVSYTYNESYALQLLNMRMSARILGNLDQDAPLESLQAMLHPPPAPLRSSDPGTTEPAPATEEPTTEPTEPTAPTES